MNNFLPKSKQKKWFNWYEMENPFTKGKAKAALPKNYIGVSTDITFGIVEIWGFILSNIQFIYL